MLLDNYQVHRYTTSITIIKITIPQFITIKITQRLKALNLGLIQFNNKELQRLLASMGCYQGTPRGGSLLVLLFPLIFVTSARRNIFSFPSLQILG